MKISWMIFILCFLFGCQNQKDAQTEIDKTTVSNTYYLRTVVHDEHLFILSTYGYFIHHLDCPCLKNKEEPPKESVIQPPIIIDLERLR